MNIRGKLLSVVGTVTAAVAAILVTPSAAHAAIDPFTCFIQTADGHYVTAVGGGGRTTDVMHTNATRPSTWERFTKVPQGDLFGHFALRTFTGNYVTAVNSGGLNTTQVSDVLHTDATRIGTWELFSTFSLSDGTVGIRVFDNHFLAALNGGNRTTKVFDSDRANLIIPDTHFRFTCGV
ncbi:fascin domain-containing protein [Dactylosporangium sp. CS-033363]|uniref:fascin domain-containing protein n=1 Tax=unclassified Dactylosporangium TaxID=2621675 RepID=UPI003D8E5672